jgi:hypothetical protein
MKYGMNLLLWGGEFTMTCCRRFERLKAMGYDGVEVPMFNLDLDYAGWAKKLDDLGLATDRGDGAECSRTTRSAPTRRFELRG